MRRILAGLVIAAVAGSGAPLAGPASPASAHAYLVRSAPADGAVLPAAPGALTLSFTEHVEVPATTVAITDGDGQRYRPTSVTAVAPSDDAAADTEEPMEVAIGLPPMPSNVYHVTWRTLSSDDLHATTGNLVIGVGRTVRASESGQAPAGPAPAEAILRWLALLGLSMLLGGSALAALGRAARPLRRQVLTAAAAGGALALAASPALIAAQVYAGTGELGAMLGRQLSSGRWLAGELGCLLLTAVAIWARPGGRPRDSTAAAVVLGAGGAAGAATGFALLGHSGSAVGVATAAVHVLAAGAWAGSVVVIAAVVAAARLRRAGTPGIRELLRAFAAVAVTSVAALTVTGLLMTGDQVASADALITTPYGLLLIAKVVVAASAGLLGLRTFRLLRGARGVLPRRAVVAEGAALAAVLALAAAVASAGPARGPQFVTEAAGRLVPQVSGQVSDVVDTIAIRPNLPGRNVVSVRISDTRRPALAPVTGVSIVLRAPDGSQLVRPAARAADGSWTAATDDIRLAGAWKVSVTVFRDGVPPVTDAHGWTVGSGQQPRRIVSATPLRPAATWLAITLAGLCAVAAMLLLARRGRKIAPAEPPRAAPPLVAADR